MFLKKLFIVFKRMNEQTFYTKGYLFRKIDQISGSFQHERETRIDFIKFETASLYEARMFCLLIWLS